MSQSESGMVEWLHRVEDAFLHADRAALRALATAGTPPQADLAQSVIAVLDGHIEQVLASPFARSICAPLLSLSSAESVASFDPASLAAAAQQYIAQSADRVLAQGSVLFLAATFLSAFVCQNYTGPPSASIGLFDGVLDAEAQQRVHDLANRKLRLDGEDVYDHSHHPVALLVARALLLQSSIDFSACKSAAWWSMRYARVHQDLLEQNSATLKAFVDEVIPKAMVVYGLPAQPAAADAPADGADAGENFAALAAAPAPVESEIPPSHDYVLATHLYLEASHLYHFYWSYKQIDTCLAQAQSALGVSVSLTGVMGKRTKWQKNEQAQLVVQVRQEDRRAAEVAAALANSAGVDEALLENLPHNLALDSDVLLETPTLSASPENPLLSEGQVLGVEEQALLLQLHETTRRTRASHITRDEEMMAYVVRALMESKRSAAAGSTAMRNWALECSALFHRSVLECSDRHAQDRALQQLEELSAIYDKLHAPTTVASVAELAHTRSIEQIARSDVVRARMAHIWLSNYPPIWLVKTGIAATFQKIGLYKSALDLFLSINAYEGVIESCMLLGKITQAEELIRARLAERPDEPKLLCLLADCTRDTAFYEQAWEKSGRTYPRAQRSLANFKMQRGQHAEAIPHFQLALDLNPVFPAEWYAMGWCAMQIKSYDIAAVAFSRTVSFDPEYANAWNNLAASHLHLRNKSAGFNALEQAVKFKTDSWKLWENYMVTALDLREVGKAITGMEKVVALKAGLNRQGQKEARSEAEEKTGEAGKNVVDEQVLTILHRVVLEQAKEQGAEIFLVTRFLQLLNAILQHVVNHPLVYACLADVYAAKKDLDKSILMREKQVRFLQDAGSKWTERLEAIQDVVAAHEQLVEAYLQSNTRPNLMAAKFATDTLSNKLKKLPIVTDSQAGQGCLAQLDGLLQRVVTATAAAPAATPTAPAAASSSSATSSMNIWR